MTHGQIFVALGAALGLALTMTPGHKSRVTGHKSPPVLVRQANDLVVEHTVLISEADHIPGLGQLESIRYAELVLAPEGQPCR